jgi:hypothetical protein
MKATQCSLRCHPGIGILVTVVLVTIFARGTRASPCPYGCDFVTCYETGGGGYFYTYKSPGCLWNWYSKNASAPYTHEGTIPVQKIACYGTRLCDPGAVEPAQATCSDSLPNAQWTADPGCWNSCTSKVS